MGAPGWAFSPLVAPTLTHSLARPSRQPLADELLTAREGGVVAWRRASQSPGSAPLAGPCRVSVTSTSPSTRASIIIREWRRYLSHVMPPSSITRLHTHGEAGRCWRRCLQESVTTAIPDAVCTEMGHLGNYLF